MFKFRELLYAHADEIAELRADGDVVLEALEPQRWSDRLTAADLPGVFDRLEGQLRKRLNDKRVRDGEEGLRGDSTHRRHRADSG